MDVTLVLLGLSLFILWLLLLALLQPATLLGIGLSALALNVSWVSVTGLGKLGLLSGVVTIVMAAAKARASARRTDGLTSPPRSLYLPLAVGTTGLVLSPAAIAPADAALLSVGLVVLGLVLIQVLRYLPGRTVSGAAFAAVSVVMSASLAFTVLSIEQPNLFGRSVGVFSNPNTLGMMSGLWCVLSLSRHRIWVVVVPISLSLIVLSGSRGALLATTVGIVGWLWLGGPERPSWYRRHLYSARVLLSLLTMASAFRLNESLRNQGESYVDAGILRSSLSGRDELVRTGMQRFFERPFTGWGLGTEQIEGVEHPHTLPLTLSVQLGIIGLVLALAAIVVLVAATRHGDPGLGALGLFGAVAMISESWLFGTGGIITWCFWFSFGGGLAAVPRDGRIIVGEGGLAVSSFPQSRSPAREVIGSEDSSRP